MNAFFLTSEMKAKRNRMRLELVILKVKEKLFGKLSENNEKRRREILMELSKHY